MNLKTLALILKGLRVSGSWSQCMRKKTERGLSMNPEANHYGVLSRKKREGALSDASFVIVIQRLVFCAGTMTKFAHSGVSRDSE